MNSHAAIPPRVLLEAVTELVRVAGAVALRYFRTGLAVETKADGSPVTAADRAAETAALDGIARRFPAYAALGAELGASCSWARRWLFAHIDRGRMFLLGTSLCAH